MKSKSQVKSISWVKRMKLKRILMMMKKKMKNMKESNNKKKCKKYKFQEMMSKIMIFFDLMHMICKKNSYRKQHFHRIFYTIFCSIC